MKKIDFVFFDAGGGHRSAATALKAVIESQGRPWQVRLVNLQEVLEPLDVFRKYAGIRVEDVYNKMLAKGWTLGAEHLLPLLQSLIRNLHDDAVHELEKLWAVDPPDLVASVVPNFNRVLFDGLKNACPAVPYVTILTDLADYPPHFWMERQDQHVVCGTEKAVAQARSMGYPERNIYSTSGMILRPKFYEDLSLNRCAERKKLGLDPHRSTGLVLFGGQGSSVMLRVVSRLQTCTREVQLILICGRNEKLAARLRSLPSRIPLHVVGFTSEVPYYMRLSDFFIGKPGPGSISEALALQLPVVVERSAWTLPQERYNAEWVVEKGAGIVVSNFREINAAVERLLEPAAFSRFRASAAAVQNRAVFEIPGILETILSRT